MGQTRNSYYVNIVLKCRLEGSTKHVDRHLLKYAQLLDIWRKKINVRWSGYIMVFSKRYFFIIFLFGQFIGLDYKTLHLTKIRSKSCLFPFWNNQDLKIDSRLL